jgi:Ca2+/H+ antiporter
MNHLFYFFLVCIFGRFLSLDAQLNISTDMIVNYIIQDGKSNWLEGLILMSLYLILAVTFWFCPGIF